MLSTTVAYTSYASEPVEAGGSIAEALAGIFCFTPNLTRYLLLDGGTLANLAERLDSLDVTVMPVFDVDMRPDLASVSPYLVQADPHNEHVDKLLDQWCHESAREDDPFALLDLRPGILLMSSLDIKEIRDFLRRFVILPDESGTRMFFRFQEPGMLYALLRAEHIDAQAAVFSGISRFIWAEEALEDDCWRIRCVDQAVPPGAKPRLPKLDKAARVSLAHGINRRRARQIARDAGGTLAKRIDVARVIVRLLDAKHSGPDWLLLHFYRLLISAPDDWQIYWWKRVEARTESLAVLNRGMHDHHGVGEFKP